MTVVVQKQEEERAAWLVVQEEEKKEEEEDAAQDFLLSFSSCPRSSHSELWTFLPCPELGSTVDIFLTSVLLALERPLASGSRSLGVGCY